MSTPTVTPVKNQSFLESLFSSAPSIQDKVKDFNYVVTYNPEFIAQGTILKNQEKLTYLLYAGVCLGGFNCLTRPDFNLIIYLYI